MDKRVLLSGEEYQARLAGGEMEVPSETARRVLERRYLRRDDQGAICETPDGLFERVAHHAAGAEPGAEQTRAQDMFAGMMRRRNVTTNTIAPAGTLSILAGCSAGIEPLFAPAYHRRFLDGEEVDEVHPLFAKRLQGLGLLTDTLVGRAARAGHARVEGMPADLARLFVTAHQVPPRHHVAIGAAFQKHVDNSVSKTVNLSSDATVDDVAEVIGLAHALGCKGITVYRDASRTGQVLSTPPASTSGSPGPILTSQPPAASPGDCPVCGSALLSALLSVPPAAGRIHYCEGCAYSRL